MRATFLLFFIAAALLVFAFLRSPTKSSKEAPTHAWLSVPRPVDTPIARKVKSVDRVRGVYVPAGDVVDVRVQDSIVTIRSGSGSCDILIEE